IATFTDFNGPDVDPTTGKLDMDSKYKATINWGDDTGDTLGSIDLQSDGTLLVKGTHNFLVAGLFGIKVTVMKFDVMGNLTFSSTTICASLAVGGNTDFFLNQLGASENPGGTPTFSPLGKENLSNTQDPSVRLQIVNSFLGTDAYRMGAVRRLYLELL